MYFKMTALFSSPSWDKGKGQWHLLQMETPIRLPKFILTHNSLNHSFLLLFVTHAPHWKNSLYSLNASIDIPDVPPCIAIACRRQKGEAAGRALQCQNQLWQVQSKVLFMWHWPRLFNNTIHSKYERNHWHCAKEINQVKWAVYFSSKVLVCM